VERLTEKQDEINEDKALGDPYVMCRSPEEIYLKKEADEAIQAKLLRAVEGDKELEDVLLCVFAENMMKPSDIAEETGIEVKRVYKLREKLERIVNKLTDGEKDKN
jgi:hypothetical protein